MEKCCCIHLNIYAYKWNMEHEKITSRANHPVYSKATRPGRVFHWFWQIGISYSNPYFAHCCSHFPLRCTPLIYGVASVPACLICLVAMSEWKCLLALLMHQWALRLTCRVWLYRCINSMKQDDMKSSRMAIWWITLAFF